MDHHDIFEPNWVSQGILLIYYTVKVDTLKYMKQVEGILCSQQD